MISLWFRLHWFQEIKHTLSAIRFRELPRQERGGEGMRKGITWANEIRSSNERKVSPGRRSKCMCGECIMIADGEQTVRKRLLTPSAKKDHQNNMTRTQRNMKWRKIIKWRNGRSIAILLLFWLTKRKRWSDHGDYMESRRGADGRMTQRWRNHDEVLWWSKEANPSSPDQTTWQRGNQPN